MHVLVRKLMQGVEFVSFLSQVLVITHRCLCSDNWLLDPKKLQIGMIVVFYQPPFLMTCSRWHAAVIN